MLCFPMPKPPPAESKRNKKLLNSLAPSSLYMALRCIRLYTKRFSKLSFRIAARYACCLATDSLLKEYIPSKKHTTAAIPKNSKLLQIRRAFRCKREKAFATAAKSEKRKAISSWQQVNKKRSNPSFVCASFVGNDP